MLSEDQTVRDAYEVERLLGESAFAEVASLRPYWFSNWVAEKRDYSAAYERKLSW